MACNDRDVRCVGWIATCETNAQSMSDTCPRTCRRCVGPRQFETEVLRPSQRVLLAERNVTCGAWRRVRATYKAAFDACDERDCDVVAARVDVAPLLNLTSRRFALGFGCRTEVRRRDERLAFFVRDAAGASGVARVLVSRASPASLLKQVLDEHPDGLDDRQVFVARAAVPNLLAEVLHPECHWSHAMDNELVAK